MDNTQTLTDQYPQVKEMMAKKPIFWKNPDYGKSADLPFSKEEIFDAVARWDRFAPFIEAAFPETANMHGIIESPLIRLDKMKQLFNQDHQTAIAGSLFLKADSQLPISGSIKSRGGIYEVLKFAEHVALTKGNLKPTDNYAILRSPKYKQLFAQYGVMVASTGNLALSVGIAASTFGFKTTVYMSRDAKEWKKAKLRANGLNVVELDTDFSSVIPKAREAAAKDDQIHFIDDEGSRDLFIGYAVAGVRLKKQLDDLNIKVDQNHPVVVYLPAGVGGSPSGVTFGLKTIIGENIHAIFCEPTHVPSVTLGMMTKLNNEISVFDIGLDGKTAADGLAVGRPSRIAGKVMRTLLFGSTTFQDPTIYKYEAQLMDTEHITVEPSAAAGFTAIERAITEVPDFNSENATHIVWATGGSMMPESERRVDHAKGEALLKS